MEPRNIRRDIFIISFVFIIASLIFYSYYWFFVPQKLQLLYQNWDGPSYVVIAKSLYDPDLINQVNTISRNPEFFAAHFPLYPLLIRLFSFIGYFRSMLFVSQLFSLLFIITFYLLSVRLKLKRPLILCLLLVFLTPRWFIVSHVGSSEPVFLFFLTFSILFLAKKNLVASAIAAFLAQMTRPQGILIFIGILFYLAYQHIFCQIRLSELLKKYAPFLLVPLGVFLIFLIYLFQYHNFFAFFSSISQFGHLKLIPFSAFFPGNSAWKEIYIFYYFLFLVSIIRLMSKNITKVLGFLAISFTLPLLFLVHEDIGRYSIPMIPFIFIAFHRLITSKGFIIASIILIPAIFAYSINYTLLNLSP